ncbi:MAG: universal stress protein [Anaerolineales bacterium]|jgi:nucleotide-binding universal stress UspA family protein
MGLILCATRGGEASIPTQLRAIDLAKQWGDDLAFLYVADSSFLNKTAAAVVVDVDDELAHMGEFLLTMAAERASDHGVEAKTVIRTGVVREVLPDVAKELGATTIILGRPSGEDSRFDAEGYEKFVQEIESETQAQVLSYQEPSPE